MLKDIFKKLLRKAFYIDLEDALTYPSSQIICRGIEKYCADNKQKLEFVSKVTPVTFIIDGTLYDATVRMSHGGYYIYCKEA